MKKIAKLLLATIMLFSSITFVQANGYNEHYYSNEPENYRYLNNVIHAPSYDLPEKYDSREYGYVTSVKNQGSYDTHWLHALVGASESNILKKGLATAYESLNLSELAAGYVVYHNKATDTNLTTNDSSSSDMTDFLYGNGHLEGAAFMLSRGGGITSETTLPYSMANSDDLAYYLNGNTMLWADYRLKDAIFIPRNDEAAIKEAIIKYGAVALKYQSCRINDPKQTYVYRTGGTINSALTIIGYDDTISKEWFYGDKPSRDGAWLVKNSWGNTANGGIFYLSYEHMMQDAVAYVYAPSDYYDHNYHYDATPSMTMTSAQPNTPLKAANIYRTQKGTTSKPEYLRSVAVAIGSVNTNYEIQIYTNLQDESNPESGTAVFDTPIKGSKNHPGYYTIDLPEAVELEKDTLFSVVVTLRNRNQRHLTFIYTSESSKFGDYVNFVEGTSLNQSFIYENDAWNDLHYQQKTARIRALTTTKTIHQTSQTLDVSTFALKNDEFVYNGAAIEPEVICVNGSLQEGRDYRVTYENNILSGNASVVIEGIGDYKGVITLPFTIAKRELLLSMVEDIPTQISYGTQVTPAERVLFENRILQKGIDYNVTYGENTSKKGSIVIQGIGEFSGTVTKEFSIKGLDEMCYFQAIVQPSDAGSVSIQSSGFSGEMINAVTSPYSSRYVFVYWLKDGKIISRDNPLCFMAEESATLTAQYYPTKEYEDLQNLWIELKDIENDSYSESTWTQFQADLQLAQYIVSNYMINDERLGACYYWLSDSYQALSKEENNPDIEGGTEPTINYDDAQSYFVEIESKNLQENIYTPNSWSVFKQAFDQLEEMLNVQNATLQDEVDVQLSQLQKAYEALVPRANVSSLELLYTQWSTYNEEEYTKSSWEQFVIIKNEIVAMLQNFNASQAEVDEMLNQYQNASELLVSLANKSALESLYAQWLILNEEEYTKSSWTQLEVNKNLVMTMLQNQDVSQAEVDALYEKVKNIGVVKKGNVESLNEYIEAYQKLDAKLYTSDSYAQLQLVLNEVKAVLVNTDNLTQEDVTAYEQKLLDANRQLIKVVKKVENFNALVMNYKDVKLTWDKVSEADVYLLQKLNSENEWEDVSTLETNEYIYQQKTGVTYTYRVLGKRLSDGCLSEASDIQKATTQLSGVPVLDIQQLSSTRFTLSWTTIEGATRYIIYRKAKGGSYQKVLTLGGTDTSYTTSSLAPNKYYFIVKAARYDSKDRVMTNKSNEVSGTSVYAKPVLKVSKTSDTTALLTWDEIEGVSNYEVYRKSSSQTSYKKLKTIKSCSYVSKSLKNNETYYYKVRGFKKVGEVIFYTPYSSAKTLRMK